jgi:hypothetical protein
VSYEPGFYIPEDDILHSHIRENLKSYKALTGWTLYRRRNVSPVRYELGFSVPEDGILQSDRRENLKCYSVESSSRHLMSVSAAHIVSMSQKAISQLDVTKVSGSHSRVGNNLSYRRFAVKFLSHGKVHLSQNWKRCNQTKWIFFRLIGTCEIEVDSFD